MIEVGANEFRTLPVNALGEFNESSAQAAHHLDGGRSELPDFVEGEREVILPGRHPINYPQNAALVEGPTGLQVTLRQPAQQILNLVDGLHRSRGVVNGRRQCLDCDIDEKPHCIFRVLLESPLLVEMNACTELLLGNESGRTLSVQDHTIFEQRVPDTALDHDETVQPAGVVDQLGDVYRCHRLRLPDMFDGQLRRIAVLLRSRCFARRRPGGGLIGADDDLPSRIAERLQHAHDLKIVETLDELRKHQHAGHQHGCHDRCRQKRHALSTLTIDPGQRGETVHEGRDKHAERVKQQPIACKPHDEAGRINHGIELHEHEGDREHDAGQRHHAGSNCREVGLCGGRRQIETDGQERRFKARHQKTGSDARNRVKRGYQPELHATSFHNARIPISPLGRRQHLRDREQFVDLDQWCVQHPWINDRSLGGRATPIVTVRCARNEDSES